MIDVQINGGPQKPGGSRIFKRFSTLKDAQEEAGKLRDQRQREGKAAFELPASIRIEAGKCVEMLAPFAGATLIDAVTHYVERVLRYRNAPMIAGAVAQLVEEKSKSNRRPRTLDNLRSRWGRFAATFGQRQLGTITETELAAWLDTVSTSPTNRHNYRRAVLQLYRAAMRKKWTGTNTMADATDRVELEEKPAGILTVEQAASLLEHAAEFDLAAYAALGMFCGLRREEIERLTWDAVKIGEGVVTVGAEVAKLRRQRHVTLNETALAWLTPIAKRRGPVVNPVNLRKRFDDWRSASGIKRWPDNALRHTFGSMALATMKDEVRVAHEMGNSPSMVHRHYKALTTEATAALFWLLRPSDDVDGSGKIVALRVANG